MPNLERQKTRHNQKVLGDNDKNSNNEERTCNCKIKDECPVNETCLTRGVIYKATVKYNNKNMSYIVSTGRQFKSRYNEHIESFRNKSKKTQY